MRCYVCKRDAVAIVPVAPTKTDRAKRREVCAAHGVQAIAAGYRVRTIEAGREEESDNA